MWRDTESDNKDVISNNENQIINLCVYTGMEMMFIHTNKDIYIYLFFPVRNSICWRINAVSISVVCIFFLVVNVFDFIPRPLSNRLSSVVVLMKTAGKGSNWKTSRFVQNNTDVRSRELREWGLGWWDGWVHVWEFPWGAAPV